MPRQNVLQKEDETFRLLVFTYGASENAIFVHLGSTRFHDNPIVKRRSLHI